MTTAVVARSVIRTRDPQVRTSLERARDDIGQSRALLRWNAEQLVAFYANFGLLRRISGGSDAALILGAITDTVMCVDCIARRTGVPTEHVNRLLQLIADNVRLAVDSRQCAACLQHLTTFAIVTNGDSSRQANGSLQTTILRFLERHRGTAFCSACVAACLFDGQNVDVAMRRLEGRPTVSRHHGQCSVCGKTRLLIRSS